MTPHRIGFSIHRRNLIQPTVTQKRCSMDHDGRLLEVGGNAGGMSSSSATGWIRRKAFPEYRKGALQRILMVAPSVVNFGSFPSYPFPFPSCCSGFLVRVLPLCIYPINLSCLIPPKLNKTCTTHYQPCFTTQPLICSSKGINQACRNIYA